MATYILLDENRKSFMGTDTFIQVDDRLSVDGKINSAIDSLKRMAGVRPSLVKEVRYMAKYSSAKYDYTTYQYSGKLIPIKYSQD
jgi:hypothetical protein